jgi:hypothetical protein
VIASAVRLAQLTDLVASGELEIPVARTYPLDQVREAFTELAERHTHGKDRPDGVIRRPMRPNPHTPNPSPERYPSVAWIRVSSPKGARIVLGNGDVGVIDSPHHDPPDAADATSLRVGGSGCTTVRRSR